MRDERCAGAAQDKHIGGGNERLIGIRALTDVRLFSRAVKNIYLLFLERIIYLWYAFLYAQTRIWKIVADAACGARGDLILKIYVGRRMREWNIGSGYMRGKIYMISR